MNKVAKATVSLMIATMIAKILGFSRELVLASAYGASMYSDAYLVAMNIPGVIFFGVATAISTIFIPIYVDIESKLGEERGIKFSNNIINIVILVSTLLIIMGIIFVKPLVNIFAYGFNRETFELTVKFTRILMLGIGFIGISSIMTSYLQVKNNFIIPGIVTVPYNIIIIISIILSIKYGPVIMIWGTLIGTISQFIFQVPFAIKQGYKFKFGIDFKDLYTKKAILLTGPVFIGVAVNQVNAMIDRTLASGLIEGSISALNYANKLNTFVMMLFIASISTVIYPVLSKLSSEKNKDQFIKSIVTSINSVILLVIPITIGAIVLSNPIVKLLFERGQFDYKATEMTSNALRMYSIGMVAFGLRDILSKVFYSLQDTKTPMVNGTIAMVINILLNIILVKCFGMPGIALATSISAIICIFLLLRKLKYKIGYFGQDKIIKLTIKSTISALLMGFVVSNAFHYISIFIANEIILLLICIIIGVIIYGVIIKILKVEEINIIESFIVEKLTKYSINIKVNNS